MDELENARFAAHTGRFWFVSFVHFQISGQTALSLGQLEVMARKPFVLSYPLTHNSSLVPIHVPSAQQSAHSQVFQITQRNDRRKRQRVGPAHPLYINFTKSTKAPLTQLPSASLGFQVFSSVTTVVCVPIRDTKITHFAIRFALYAIPRWDTEVQRALDAVDSADLADGHFA